MSKGSVPKQTSAEKVGAAKVCAKKFMPKTTVLVPIPLLRFNN